MALLSPELQKVSEHHCPPQGPASTTKEQECSQESSTCPGQLTRGLSASGEASVGLRGNINFILALGKVTLCNVSSFSWFCGWAGLGWGYLSPELLPPHPAQAREHLPCQLLLQESWNPSLGWLAGDLKAHLIPLHLPHHKKQPKVQVQHENSSGGARIRSWCFSHNFQTTECRRRHQQGPGREGMNTFPGPWQGVASADGPVWPLLSSSGDHQPPKDSKTPRTGLE